MSTSKSTSNSLDSETKKRIKKVSWPQFVILLDRIKLDRDEFLENDSPSSRTLRFEDQLTVKNKWPEFYALLPRIFDDSERDPILTESVTLGLRAYWERFNAWICLPNSFAGPISAHKEALKDFLEKEILDSEYVHLRGDERETSSKFTGHPFSRDASNRLAPQLMETENSNADSRSKVVDSVIAYLLRSKEPVVMLGDPGSGKSLTLAKAVLDLLAKPSRRRIPVLVRLGGFHVEEDPIDRHHIIDHVKTQLEANPFNSSLYPLLQQLEKWGFIVWFFDAMDEMSRDRYKEHTKALNNFARETVAQGNRCIFSCRLTDFHSVFTQKRLQLRPFDVKQREIFFLKHLKFPLVYGEKLFESAEALAKWMSAPKSDMAIRLGETVGNPFVLKLLCSSINRGDPVPQSRVMLLQSYLKAEIERDRTKRIQTSDEGSASSPDGALLDQQLLFDNLSLIAYLISTEGKGCFISEKRIQEVDFAQRSLLTEVIKEGRSAGILQMHNNQTDVIGFRHHRFDEFFTAYHLHRAKVHNLEWKDKLDSPRWLETMQNLILLGTDDPRVVSALADSIRDLLAEGKINFTKQSSEPKGNLDKIVFSFEQERLMNLRVEVAAKVIGQARGVIPQVTNELDPVVREAINFLIEHGKFSMTAMVHATANLPTDGGNINLKALSKSGSRQALNALFGMMVTNNVNTMHHLEFNDSVLCLALARGTYLENRKLAKTTLQTSYDEDTEIALNLSWKVWRGEFIVFGLLLGLMLWCGPFFATFWLWGPAWWNPIFQKLQHFTVLPWVGWGLVICAIAFAFEAGFGTKGRYNRWSSVALFWGKLLQFGLGTLLSAVLSISLFDCSLTALLSWIFLSLVIAYALHAWDLITVLIRMLSVGIFCFLMVPRTDSEKRFAFGKYIREVWNARFPDKGIKALQLAFSGVSVLILALVPSVYPVALKSRPAIFASVDSGATYLTSWLVALKSRFDGVHVKFPGITLPQWLTSWFEHASFNVGKYFQNSQDGANAAAKVISNFFKNYLGLSVDKTWLFLLAAFGICGLLIAHQIFPLLGRSSNPKDLSVVAEKAPSLEEKGKTILVIAGFAIIIIFIFGISKMPDMGNFITSWTGISFCGGIIITWLVGGLASHRAKEGPTSTPGLRTKIVKIVGSTFAIASLGMLLTQLINKPIKLPQIHPIIFFAFILLGTIFIIILTALLTLIWSRQILAKIQAWRMTRIKMRNTPISKDEWIEEWKKANGKKQVRLLNEGGRKLRVSQLEFADLIYSLSSFLKDDNARFTFEEVLYQISDEVRLQEKDFDPEKSNSL